MKVSCFNLKLAQFAWMIGAEYASIFLRKLSQISSYTS